MIHWHPSSLSPHCQCVVPCLRSNHPAPLSQHRHASARHPRLSCQCRPFTRSVCCHCYDCCPDWIYWTFFGSRRAAELHVFKSPHCRGAGQGVKTITQRYRDSKQAEDQDVEPVGAPGPWPARPAGISHIINDLRDTRISTPKTVSETKTRILSMIS